jgi:dTDP-4-amino-4,6-dideoxyglucose
MSRASARALAALGGAPAFPRGLRFTHPTPPELSRLVDRLSPMLESGRLTNYGPYVQAFERAIAARVNAAHCVAMANATMGLMLTPWAWQVQGEVIAPSFTFSATVHALVWSRATPVLVDIDPDTWTIDPEAVDAAVTPRTEAIVAVTVFGVPPDLDALREVAARRRLRLLYDTAQGFGSRYGGRPLGGFGDAEVLSFHAAKTLPTGEGGAVCTNDEALARRLRLACNFGNPGSGDCELIGLNAKMSEWSALLGLAGLETFDRDLTQRLSLWDAYRRRLQAIPGIAVQAVPETSRSNGQNIAVLVDEQRFGMGRDVLERTLAAEGIECKRYFDPPIHRMRAYAKGPHRSAALPVTERVARAALCLPLHGRMEAQDVERVCDLVEAAHGQRDAIRARAAD